MIFLGSYLKLNSKRTHNTHTMERGCDTSWRFIMPNVELQARVKEQHAAVKAAKLKYRGVTYIKTGK